MAGWEPIGIIYQKEKRQRYEEGFDTHSMPDDVKDLSEEAIHHLLNQFAHLPLRQDFFYQESSELNEILQDANIIIDQEIAPTFDQFYGAMLGRSIGCMLGKPLEVGPYFWESTRENPGWKQVKKWFQGASQYPIRDYVPKHSKAASEGLYVGCETCLKDQIQYVETDDDIRYTLLSLELLETVGPQFSSYDVGKLWHQWLPYQYLCTAETQAYLNFAQRTHHLSPSHTPFTQADQDYVRTHHNPYREWIGAQIRIDGYAYAAAGNPILAARMAYQDASFSHVKNGIYGAMFFAALIASAFVEKNIDVCIHQTLQVIPKTSRLYEYLIRTIAIVRSEPDLETMIEKVWDYLLDFDPAHTMNNACICVASILFGNGDFNASVSTAVLFGLDTDCNGATVGSFMGALLGESGIHEHWKKPLNDTIYASLPNYHPASIKAVSQRYYDVYLKIKQE